MSRSDWVGQLLKTIDNMDAEAFAAFLAKDVSFRFGNAEPVAGKAAVREAVEGFFGSIKGMRHEVASVLADDDAVSFHGTVTYTRHDSSSLTVPFADFLSVRGELITEYLIFMDASQLHE
ncbi:MAG: nuclear transport factor 2 family protein [Phycisphaerales bacterium]|nr:MAG: nuclear transport factor 2 family protein [Phycisphaerales bacterium]